MAISIVEFTDPGCPFAYSAEPHRLRLQWLYGDHDVDWSLRMVVLSHSPQEYLDKGFTPERQLASHEQISARYGMPMRLVQRPRMHATLPACTAVVATRLHRPQLEAAILRRLRLRNFSGELLDEPATIAGAAADVGIDPAELRRWMAEEAVRAAVDEDEAAARNPMPAARILDHKLANWPGGRRYTCPTYEITRERDGVTAVIPGFQPFAVYDVVMANILPDVERRQAPSVRGALEWAGEPLATQEVAAVCDISRDDAREELERIAEAQPLGTDAVWALPAERRAAAA
jgi:predicted DsbA family dithiol-disulfide isomerase